MVSVNIDAPAGTTVSGLKTHETPDGNPATVNVTPLLNPLIELISMRYVFVCPAEELLTDTGHVVV
jgi:hypothetical protein